jgi:hypothetical protein
MSERSNNVRLGPAEGARKKFGAERGVALILVLVLSAIAMVVMTMALYVITMGTSLSGSEKRYRTAHEAALGGVDILRPIIQDQGKGMLDIPGAKITYQPDKAGFTAKLTTADLTAYNTDISIDPSNPATYDVVIDLGTPVYRVFAKIVQTKKGSHSSGHRAVRIKTGVVPAGGLGGPMFNPTYYTITLLAQKATNPNERVRMDLVHIF